MRYFNRNRWPRVTLRGMLVAISLLAVCFSGWIYRPNQQRRAVQRITALGGMVEYYPTRAPSWLINKVGEERVYDVASVYLRMRQVSQADLRALSAFLKLRELDLGHTNVADNDMRAIAALPSLETLNLMASNVTAAGLEHLAKLPRLKMLFISSDQLTPEAVNWLRRVPNLSQLVVMEIVPRGGPVRHRFSDADVAELQQKLLHVKVLLELEIPRIMLGPKTARAAGSDRQSGPAGR